MARVVNLHAFWQQALATALAPPRERCASTFGFHPRAKTVLAFASAFRALEGAFH